MKKPKYPDIPAITSFSDMVEKNAVNFGDRTAFEFRKGRDAYESVTYYQVYGQARSAAAWIKRDMGEHQHIAIIGENSYEWLLAFLAIICGGNVAVPIDKELPANEIAELLKTADVTAAVVSKTYMDLVEGVEGLKTVTFKQLYEAAQAGECSMELIKPDFNDLAAIFFTSGTSGKSKGVMLSHGALTSEINQCCKMFDGRGMKVLAVLPFHHTFGLNVAVWLGFNQGAPVFVNKSLKTVKNDILYWKPDLMMLVPLFVETFYKQIMDGVRKEGKEEKLKKGIRFSNFLRKFGIDKRRRFFKDILDNFGGNLRYIISGGAPLDPFYVKEFRNFGIEIFNGYGTTECSPCVAVNRLGWSKDGSVGQLCPGMLARVSGEGEVQLNGPVLMQGYYKNPEATSAVLKDGWYCTGDVGRVDKDGFLFLTGRIKNLIILSNGENISPEELEGNFQTDPGVKEVLVYEDSGKIVAEIYPEEGFTGNEEYFTALMNRVNEGRPAYKQVSAVRLRDCEFIKNTSKKIVRYKNIPQKV